MKRVLITLGIVLGFVTVASANPAKAQTSSNSASTSSDPRAPEPCRGATRKFSEDWSTYGFNLGPYVAANSPWNKGELVNGKDYTETITLCPSTFPNGTVIAWSWPSTPASGNVYSFQYIAYGDYGNGPNSTAPTKNIKPKQITSINTLMLNQNVTFSGSTDQYVTIYDIFLEPGPKPVYQQYLHEVEIPIHLSSNGCSYVQGKSRGTFIDSQGLQWSIAYSPHPQQPMLWFIPADCRDLGNYTIDLLALFKAAVNLGFLTGDEWFTGLSLGVEPAMGSGSITVHSMSTNYD